MIWAKKKFEKRSAHFEIKIQSFRKQSWTKPIVWMDFKNSFAWLTTIKKLIFRYFNFVVSGHFWSFFKDVLDQKLPEPKNLIQQKISFFMPVNLAKKVLNFVHAPALFSRLTSETLNFYFKMGGPFSKNFWLK